MSMYMGLKTEHPVVLLKTDSQSAEMKLVSELRARTSVNVGIVAGEMAQQVKVLAHLPPV